MRRVSETFQWARAGLALSALCGLAACMAPQVTRDLVSPSPGDIGPLAEPAVVNSAQGTCFDRATTPAVIETVTEQILVQPAQIRSDGSVETPAAFRTVTRQRILRERREVEFETPCASLVTPEFTASVQRALVARGYYSGPITGQMDARTRTAIERFQTAQGDVSTGTLTLKSARTLGLVALPRDSI